jgi:hypothetical protein
VSTQNLQHGVGVLFYTENDPQGRQRYEGQIINSLPGEQKKYSRSHMHKRERERKRGGKR